MPQRRDYIDELKGLGILLVVLGHFIEQYRMGYSFVSASFFCIYAFHMALFCICSGLVARFNPRKLVTQQLWLYLVGQTLMLAFRAAVLRENFAETGGLLAAWLLPWRHIWYLYALIFWHLTLPVLCRLRDRLGLAGSCLGMALAVGLALMLYYAAHKQGYHVDELYTYELANYPGGFYALEDGYMDSWHDGSFYSAVLTPGRLFDYTIPWNNQKIDVHPPLYYCLIYTAESLFPQLGLPWVGLLPNFVCILAGAAVLYCTAKRLIGRFWPAWTAAACWLLCVGVQGMAVFTRMYSLMMLEGIVLLYCHLVLWQALQAGQKPPRAVWPGLFAVTMAGALTQYFFLVFCFFVCGLFGVWLLAARRFKTAGGYVVAEFAALAAAYAAFPTMKAHIFSGSRGKEAFASVFDLSALAEWGRSIGTVVQLLAAQFGGLWLWAVVVAAAAVVLWRRGCRLRGKGLFAAGLLLASAGYVALIDKAAPFEADRYYVVIYAAVVLAVAVVLARLAPQHETLLLLALVPILAAHRTDPNAYLYEDAAPRKAALADPERLPAVVLNKAGYEVAPDLFLEEFAKREAVDQASGEDDAASLRAAVESRDLHDGFLLYGYNYDAAVLRALAEDTLDVEKIEFVTDGERCPVYYIELK